MRYAQPNGRLFLIRPYITSVLCDSKSIDKKGCLLIFSYVGDDM